MKTVALSARLRKSPPHLGFPMDQTMRLRPPNLWGHVDGVGVPSRPDLEIPPTNARNLDGAEGLIPDESAGIGLPTHGVITDRCLYAGEGRATGAPAPVHLGEMRRPTKSVGQQVFRIGVDQAEKLRARDDIKNNQVKTHCAV